MEKISVIVPVYKVEKYLRTCLDSIVRQSYKNLEIILVDDGSPDACGEICDEYAKKDSRIQVIHKENGGLCAARNDGIEAATSEWLLFVDSDDWLDEDYIECLAHNLGEKTSLNICGAMEEYADGTHRKRFGFTGVDCIREKNLLQLAQANVVFAQRNYIVEGRRLSFGLSAAPWNRLYNRELIMEHGQRFDTQLQAMEDLCFNLHYLEYVTEIYQVEAYGYHYRQVFTGNTKSYRQDRLKVDEKSFHVLDRYLLSTDNPYLPDAVNARIVAVFTMNLDRYYLSKANPSSKKEKKRILRETLESERYRKAFLKVKPGLLSFPQKLLVKAARHKAINAILLLHWLDRKRKKILLWRECRQMSKKSMWRKKKRGCRYE